MVGKPLGQFTLMSCLDLKARYDLTFMDKILITKIIGGALRRLVFKFRFNVALPEVRRLLHMHVTIEHFESIVRHVGYSLSGCRKCVVNNKWGSVDKTRFITGQEQRCARHFLRLAHSSLHRCYGFLGHIHL